MKKLIPFLLLSLALTATPSYSEEPHAVSISPAAAMQKLTQGNARFAAGNSINPHNTLGHRAEVAKAQKPFAVIVTCSDSRLAPELLFDQGLGDIFVVRLAGNVVDDQALGSIEYAVEHLGTHLVVVLGHQKCGAVDAAVGGGHIEGHVNSIVKAIQPAVKKAKTEKGDLLENSIKENAKDVAEKVAESKPVMQPLTKAGKVNVVAGYYSLDTGKVLFLK